MIGKLIRLLRSNLYEIFYTPKLINKILFNKKYFDKKINNSNIIVFDNFEIVGHFEKRIFILKQLQKIHNAGLFYFGAQRSLILKMLYFSCGAKSINYKFSEYDNEKINKEYLYYKKKILNKYDLLNFKIDEVNLGIDIYESYLKDFSKPTLNLKDENFFKLLKYGIETHYFWTQFFFKKTVKSVLISHRNYIRTNIICKIAYKYKVPVYTINGNGTKVSKFVNDRLDECKYYSNFFDELSQKEKKYGILLSKRQLKKRFSGVVGVNMNYSTKSAFTKYKTKKKLLYNSKKLNVLICTHCFFDNPHAYGGNLFPDFYDWISFLGNLSFKTNYNWYIKPHPDYLPGTLETLKKLSKKFKKVKILNPNTSFHQLKKEGLDFVLTTYGSVAHELPLLGINVINADKYNPNSSFKYSYTPKNLKSYRNAILNLNKFTFMKKYKNDIYKFYYIHNYFINGKKLFSTNKNKLYINSKYFEFKNNKLRTLLEKKIYNFLVSNKKYLLDNKNMKIISKFEKN